jgi:hypothetical protein
MKKYPQSKAGEGKGGEFVFFHMEPFDSAPPGAGRRPGGHFRNIET